MDPFTPQLLRYGVRGHHRQRRPQRAGSQGFRRKQRGILRCYWGLRRLYASCITNVEVVAYDDLGTESIKRLTVRDLPLTVAIDSLGNDFYQLGQSRYLESVSE